MVFTSLMLDSVPVRFEVVTPPETVSSVVEEELDLIVVLPAWRENWSPISSAELLILPCIALLIYTWLAKRAAAISTIKTAYSKVLWADNFRLILFNIF